MEPTTQQQDLYTGPYEEALRLVQDAIVTVKQNIANKTGSAADLTRLLEMQIELRKVLDAQRIREIKVTWVEPEFVTEK